MLVPSAFRLTSGKCHYSYNPSSGLHPACSTFHKSYTGRSSHGNLHSGRNLLRSHGSNGTVSPSVSRRLLHQLWCHEPDDRHWRISDWTAKPGHFCGAQRQQLHHVARHQQRTAIPAVDAQGQDFASGQARHRHEYFQ